MAAIVPNLKLAIQVQECEDPAGEGIGGVTTGKCRRLNQVLERVGGTNLLDRIQQFSGYDPLWLYATLGVVVRSNTANNDPQEATDEETDDHRCEQTENGMMKVSTVPSGDGLEHCRAHDWGTLTVLPTRPLTIIDHCFVIISITTAALTLLSTATTPTATTQAPEPTLMPLLMIQVLSPTAEFPQCKEHEMNEQKENDR